MSDNGDSDASFTASDRSVSDAASAASAAASSAQSSDDGLRAPPPPPPPSLPAAASAPKRRRSPHAPTAGALADPAAEAVYGADAAALLVATVLRLQREVAGLRKSAADAESETRRREAAAAKAEADADALRERLNRGEEEREGFLTRMVRAVGAA